MTTPYDRKAWRLLAISQVRLAVTWRIADRMADRTGWLIVVGGLSLPWVMLSFYRFWLSRKRRDGDSLAIAPRWVGVAIAISFIIWIIILFFPLM
jgi:hypothetical protein